MATCQIRVELASYNCLAGSTITQSTKYVYFGDIIGVVDECYGLVVIGKSG